FLDELYETFEKYKNEPRKLQELLIRLSRIKIFDPACGSGNFLIIAYKELRILEMKIIRQLLELQKIANSFRGSNEQLELIPKSQLSFAASYNVQLFSHISLSQFYGIEIDDFAHEVATLALWLAEHQMNKEFYNEFGRANPTLPLKEAGKIVHGNACRLNWEEVCPKNEGDEIYILGNPPYQGFKFQDIDQKKDLASIFKGIANHKFLDYISCWFLKAANFITINVKAAFVSTNSICQGVQVELIWPHILNKGIEIFFAHTSFKWSNNAKSNAGVSVVIIGLQLKSSNNKLLLSKNLLFKAKNINPYLINAEDIIIKKRRNVLSQLPKITDGSGALDGGNLILSTEEKRNLIIKNPKAESFIRPYWGSNEFIKGIERWCIWIEDESLEIALEIKEIKEIIDAVLEFRKGAGTRAQTAIGRPHKFAWINQPTKSQIIIPTVSSERRPYIPIGFLDNNPIVSNSASIVHNPEPYIFGILTSQIHISWVKIVAGKLEERIRYTSAICYNTFPFPSISTQRKKEITQCVFRILEERAKHSEKTMAQLYDPDKMPDGLREAHRLNDLAVERCYRSKPFETDEERLEYLFKLYERMIAEEKEKNSKL
ncbi:MAG: DNA methyltransferase, partial [Salinivirgaceae bacterium]